METQTHWKQFCNLDYIGGYSLNGKDLNVKITSIGQEQVVGDKGKKEMCLVAHLEGNKPFIINRTNAKMISKLVGSPFVENWVGKSITLFTSTTSVAGETVECLRIRPTLPTTKAKVELTPEHPKWDSAVQFVAKGGKVEELLKSYNITPENIAKLTPDAT